MLIEFGIGHNIWWQKQDQILQYVELLLEQTEPSAKAFVFDQPILLTVITVNKQDNDTSSADSTVNENENDESTKTVSKDDNYSNYEPQIESNGDHSCVHTKEGDHAANISNTRCDIDGDQSKDRKNGPIDEVIAEKTLDVRFGMFLCTRKNAHGYRVALLWRTENSSLENSSTQFGKVLYAAQMCAFLRKQDVAMKSYEYLGPNCCRFDALVRNNLPLHSI